MSQSSCQYVPFDKEVLGLPYIHLENLSFSFLENSESLAVQQANIGIQEGKITAIIGESGSGKSTLLRLIYGLLEPLTGEVRYKGWLVPTRKDKLIPGHQDMKLVSQGFDDLNTFANVWDNVASQLPNTNIEAKQTKTAAILKRLRIDHLAKKRIADISGGEKQRVAICRALVNDPQVLLMDEPFNQVDASFRDTLQQDIKQIVVETGLTIILVSHDPTEVLALADDLIVMKDGKILDQGHPRELYERPTNPYTALLLAKSNILSSTDAKLLQIQSDTTVIIHQEWVSITASETTHDFTLTDIRFRGFYYELVITNHALQLHAISTTPVSIQIGQPVTVKIAQYISL
ncbi:MULTISPECIES: ABC transporter ATP-binding protein [Sphingobacterium]|uniref:ABC transporter ATP-binding protein n=1 Tax=Sphingobacterium TaxID=28453 RepID=UPI0010E3706C|nr:MULTISPECIES: ABC transporter ATP-binding protein [Sphingobacterium]MCW2261650.1 ABC-type sugar transport system ATPase subunit [Sphingobacterium kitahiroshimense]TCR09961.1 ABC-type Fe3+/spermidine/putrescine transport system ATPase subunit [Sphingobacterium sp. JUb78]